MENKKNSLFNKLKKESIKFINQGKFYKANIYIDILCYLDSCLYNDIVLFDSKLLTMLKYHNESLYNNLLDFIRENNIIIGE